MSKRREARDAVIAAAAAYSDDFKYRELEEWRTIRREALAALDALPPKPKSPNPRKAIYQAIDAERERLRDVSVPEGDLRQMLYTAAASAVMWVESLNKYEEATGKKWVET